MQMDKYHTLEKAEKAFERQSKDNFCYCRFSIWGVPFGYEQFEEHPSIEIDKNWVQLKSELGHKVPLDLSIL